MPTHWNLSGINSGLKTSYDELVTLFAASSAHFQYKRWPPMGTHLNDDAGAVTLSWEGDAGDSGYNNGIEVGGEYSIPPRYGWVQLKITTQNASEVDSQAYMGSYLEDNTDMLYNVPEPVDNRMYRLIGRSAWTQTLPGKPCSARLLKDYACGNLNRVSWATKPALSTMINDDSTS